MDTYKAFVIVMRDRMEYKIQEVIEYQKKILERNPQPFLIPFRWEDQSLIYMDSERMTVKDYLVQRRTTEEIRRIMQSCLEIIDCCEDILLDPERFSWDLNYCFWNGERIVGRYLPDRGYWNEPMIFYQKASYQALHAVMNNAWYDEELLLFLHRIYAAASKKDEDALRHEILRCEPEEVRIPQQNVTSDAELFKEWDAIKEEEQQNRKRKKLSLPFL